MREIISLQLGHQANYLATHFWNLQESYFTYDPSAPPSPIDHDVHWRPGLAVDGSETYMPRTVVYDLKGGFGALRRVNALYDPSSHSSASHPDAIAAQAAAVSGRSAPSLSQAISAAMPPHAYQSSLDSLNPSHTPSAILSDTASPLLTAANVRYWTDFSRVLFHPRSLVQLHEAQHACVATPFGAWATGAELFAKLQYHDDLVGRDVRPFAEEADGLRGLTVWTGLGDAWGGFAEGYVEALRDEFPKTALWVWGVQEGVLGGWGGGGGGGTVTKESRIQELLNLTRGITSITSHASLMVPVSLQAARVRGPAYQIDAASVWHTSAVLAMAMESATLPSRLREERVTLDDMAEALVAGGRRPLASIRMKTRDSVAPPMPNEFGLVDVSAAHDSTELVDLSFAVDLQRMRPMTKSNNDYTLSQLSMYRGFSKSELDLMLGSSTDVSVDIVQRYQTQLSFPMLDSFPPILKDCEPGKTQVAVETHLEANSSIPAKLLVLKSALQSRFPLEEREEMMNRLSELADEYKDGWSSDWGDSDD